MRRGRNPPSITKGEIIIIVLICGGRDLDDKQVCKWLENKFTNCYPSASKIIHGAARGADNGAAMFCMRNGFPVQDYPANWDVHGNRAGPYRNQIMLEDNDVRAVLAFPGFKGTADMKRRARRAGITVNEVDMDELNSV